MQLFDSNTKTKREFNPIIPGKVRMYVCGPTVYDRIHIGNARTFFSFDIIRRWLIHRGFEVTFAQNVTDVDDKIINRALERGIDSHEVAVEFTEHFIKDMRSFGILDPDIRPKATEEIEAMLSMISSLIEQGFAYESNGDVYFAVRKAERYGHLSHRDIDELKAGARIEQSELKNDPLDFALWKAAKPDEPSWDSPWGAGRPGWHTECAAMVERYLGMPIDIHGGGSDLVFPHHENECAQAECCWHHDLANYWMHTGMLLVDGEKMSKSLGNFYTLHEVLAGHNPHALRLLMLLTHYRSSLDFSFERLVGAQGTLERLTSCVRNAHWAADKITERAQAQAAGALTEDLTAGVTTTARETLATALATTQDEVIREMDDDFNTPRALAALFALVTEVNVAVEAMSASVHGQDAQVLHETADYLTEIFDVFGIDLASADKTEALPPALIDYACELVGYTGDDVNAAAAALLDARAVARSEKNWVLADQIRDQLAALNLKIEDTAQGSRLISQA